MMSSYLGWPLNCTVHFRIMTAEDLKVSVNSHACMLDDSDFSSYAHAASLDSSLVSRPTPSVPMLYTVKHGTLQSWGWSWRRGFLDSTASQTRYNLELSQLRHLPDGCLWIQVRSVAF